MTEWLDVSDTDTRVAYTAEAGQTGFSVPFVFYDDADLKVYVDGTLKALSTDYTASGEQEEAGGTVTLVTALAGGESVLIELDMPVELSIHIPTSGGRLDIAAINLMFSRFTSMLRQTVSRFPRALRIPGSDADDLEELPSAASRALKYLFFDADGQPSLVGSVETSAAATSFWQSVLSGTSTAAEAKTALGVTDQSSYTGLSNFHYFR